MGTKLWSADMIINDYLHPMTMDYANDKIESACTLLYSLNSFLMGFGVGIKDLPRPKNNDGTLGGELKWKLWLKDNYFEKYFPLISKAVGKYLREVLDEIKFERGNF